MNLNNIHSKMEGSKMKKVLLSVLTIVVLVIIVIAGLIGWTTATNKRLNVSNFSITSLTSKQLQLNNNPQKIILSVRTAVVKIQSGKTNQLKLNNVAKSQYHINQGNGQLTITEDNVGKHQMEIGHSPVIILTLTKDVLKELSVDQLNGTLKLNQLTVKNLQLHHHNGATVVHRLTITGEGKLTKDNGQTDFYQLSSNGLEVSVRSGQFKLNGIKKTNSGHSYHEAGNHPLIIKSGSGQVRVSQ